MGWLSKANHQHTTKNYQQAITPTNHPHTVENHQHTITRINHHKITNTQQQQITKYIEQITSKRGERFSQRNFESERKEKSRLVGARLCSRVREERDLKVSQLVVAWVSQYVAVAVDATVEIRESDIMV